MNPDQPTIEHPLIAELIEPAEPRPWGFWATMGFSLALIVFCFNGYGTKRGLG